MFVYRIVQFLNRTGDLSGLGASKYGGRWNSNGTSMLYTSENSSLALLECLVYFDSMNFPVDLFIMKIEVKDSSLIYLLPEKDYPYNWQQTDLLANKKIGDRFVAESNYLGLKLRSVVNPMNYNYILNPLFRSYDRLVKLVSATALETDERLFRS